MKKILIFSFLFLTPLYAMAPRDVAPTEKGILQELEVLNNYLDVSVDNKHVNQQRCIVIKSLGNSYIGDNRASYWRRANPLVHAMCALEFASLKVAEMAKLSVQENYKFRCIANPTPEDLNKKSELIGLESVLFQNWINAKLNLLSIEEEENNLKNSSSIK